ncbi:MAG: hypothetical protein HRU12_11725 [Phaeodactylibacter sp.]|nr:hypothetical protein [Phaeodactylibacter sp.]
MSQITVYKDSAANAIFIEDANGVQFLNSLQATNSTGVSIHDLARDIDIVTNAPFGDFVDNNGNTYGNDSTEVCNALNAIFQSSGTPLSNVPSITSSLAISLTEGETLNYELTADYGVGYEWDLSNVSGVTTVEGNVRKLIGGSSLSVGTYNIPVKAINYNGEDSETIVLTVSTPPFSNTKSVKLNNQDWLGTNAALLDATFGRSGNGSGSSDAWGFGFYYKGSTDNQGQVIFYVGNNDTTNNGYIELRQTNHNGQKRLRFRYGSSNNYIQLTTPSGSITPNTWQYIWVGYNGGTTGSASGSVTDYYSRFTIKIDDVTQSTANTHSNYGWSGSIVCQNARIGRFVSGSHLRGANVDEFAIWDSNQNANTSNIYNNGVPFDLSTLTDKPRHWARMGDENDSYPYLQDYGTEGTLVWQMYNMTSANIVSDVP